MRNAAFIIAFLLSAPCFAGGWELGLTANILGYTHPEIARPDIGVSGTLRALYTTARTETGVYGTAGRIKAFSGAFADFGGLANIKFAKRKASNAYAGIAAGYLTSGSSPITAKGFIYGIQAGWCLGIKALRLNFEIAPRYINAETRREFTSPGTPWPWYRDAMASMLIVPVSAGIRWTL